MNVSNMMQDYDENVGSSDFGTVRLTLDQNVKVGASIFLIQTYQHLP